ncbi:circadian clock protein PASD1 isoform X2 [Vicugna pacos]|uniref:Circadian clock protein PASD1 isoform X2 n=1 Tax=Vicugna pacos TaxID=30538 RepID=A0ABM5CVC8_VICPA
MDEDERENEKRDKVDESENKRKERINAIFTKLRAMLQSHGYPVKGDRAKMSQSTAALSQKNEGKVNPEMSQEKSSWIPSFQSYEVFNHMTLQSLDGFMIIVSTDGVIIFAAESIFSLLGHIPDELVGKNLLSLLPEEEKSDVSEKIAFKFPLSNSVGKHIDFCCHLRRRNVERDSSPSYEYVKFILSLRDVSNEPLLLFRSFFPRQSYESSATNFPLKDQFYLVGTVCALKAQTLQELFTAEESNKDALLTQDSDEEYLSLDHRSIQGQRIYGVEFLKAEPAAPASEDQVDIVAVEQYGSQESSYEIEIESDTSNDSRISSLESIYEVPATSSLQSFEFEPEVEYVDYMDEVEEVVEVVEMEQEDEVDQVDQEDQDDSVEQEIFSCSSVITDISDESLQIPPSIVSYINRRELTLMKMFSEQLEEKTQMLQADIRSQRDALEMLTEQLQAMQHCKLQMQPSTSRPIDSPGPQSLEPPPKKQCTEQMKGSFSDLRESTRLCGSSPALKFPEELEEPSAASIQQHLQGQEQYLQQQEQQTQEERLQEQPQEQNATVENQTLQLHMPSQTGLSVPLCGNTVIFMQIPPMIVPIQLLAEQQPSGYNQDENPGGQKDGNHSFLPEAQQGPCMSPLPLPHSPGSEMLSSTSFPHSPISCDSKLVTLKTPQDYVQLWPQLHGSRRHLSLRVNTWAPSEQAVQQDQVTWAQKSATEGEDQGFLGLETFSGPERISYFMSVEQSDLDELEE